VTEIVQRLRKAGLCAVVVLVWGAPSFGWPFAAGAAPFAVGLCLHLWAVS
jgi:hypothetical protein